MELILINDKKLKIMLSEADMEKYHITGDEMDYSKLRTRTVLKSILSDAKDATGFCTDGESFFVQLFTSAHGGCEMFITKGAPDADAQKTTACPDERIKCEKACTLLYSFDSFYPLSVVCRQLCKQKEPAQATAFSDINGTYYLLIYRESGTIDAKVDKFTFISEYGKKENPEYFKMYISEYGSWVCKNAVTTLGSL